jgi:hypothetical protein
MVLDRRGIPRRAFLARMNFMSGLSRRGGNGFLGHLKRFISEVFLEKWQGQPLTD